MNDDTSIYLIDPDQLRKLDEMAARLHGGTDRERDEGHRLWLLLNEIRDQRSPWTVE